MSSSQVVATINQTSQQQTDDFDEDSDIEILMNNNNNNNSKNDLIEILNDEYNPFAFIEPANIVIIL